MMNLNRNHRNPYSSSESKRKLHGYEGTNDVRVSDDMRRAARKAKSMGKGWSARDLYEPTLVKDDDGLLLWA